MGLLFSRCQKTVELDAAVPTKDKCTEVIAFQAGALELPNSPIVNKTPQESVEDVDASTLGSIKFESPGAPSVKSSPGKLGKRVEIKTPSQKQDSVNKNVLNRTEGRSKTGTEESLVLKASSHFDEDTSGDLDSKLLGGCKIPNSPKESLSRVARTNVDEYSIPAEVEFPPVQQCSSPDESKAADIPPETQ